MFLQDNSGGGPKDLNDAINSAIQYTKELRSAIFEFDSAAKSVTADVFGQGAKASQEMQKTISQSVKDLAELGVSATEVGVQMAAIGTIMQRNVTLTSEQLNDFIAIQKATNLTGEEMATLVEGFDSIGVGPTQAAKQIESARKSAASLGLNTGQFLKTVGDNVKLINSYNFRNGVEGFTNMVARSQALRINMADVTSLAGKLLDPSEAINLAAEFQMLGGAVGALADPFQLMNMAQNDLDGLQESIVNAASAAVSFNSETGDFAISATEMRRLRAQANALNMDYEELSNTAIKAAKRQEALSQIDILGGQFDDDTRELLANIGQFDGGELKFTVNNELMSLEEINELNPDEQTKVIKSLKERSEAANMSALDVAKQQLTVLEVIKNTLEGSARTVSAQIAGSDTYATIESNTIAAAEKVSEVIGSVLTEDNMKNVFGTVDTIFKEGVEGFAAVFEHFANEGLDDIGDAFSTAAVSAYAKMGAGDLSDDLAKAREKAKKALANASVPGLGGSNSGSGSGGSNSGSGSGVVPSAVIPVNVAKVTNTDPMKVEVVRGTFDDLNVNHTGTIQLQGGGMSLQSLQTDPTALANLTQMIQQEMARQGTTY